MSRHHLNLKNDFIFSFSKLKAGGGVFVTSCPTFPNTHKTKTSQTTIFFFLRLSSRVHYLDLSSGRGLKKKMLKFKQAKDFFPIGTCTVVGVR